MRCFCFVPVPRAPACVIAFGLVVWGAAACAPNGGAHSLAGDWDAYLARGATTLPGFEGWRRMAFAHFAAGDSTPAGSIRRRTGEPLLVVAHVAQRSDSVILSDDSSRSIDAVWRGDTLTGVLLRDGKPAGQRIRLVRRSTPSSLSNRTRCGRGPFPIRNTR